MLGRQSLFIYFSSEEFDDINIIFPRLTNVDAQKDLEENNLESIIHEDEYEEDLIEENEDRVYTDFELNSFLKDFVENYDVEEDIIINFENLDETLLETNMHEECKIILDLSLNFVDFFFNDLIKIKSLILFNNNIYKQHSYLGLKKKNIFNNFFLKNSFTYILINKLTNIYKSNFNLFEKKFFNTQKIKALPSKYRKKKTAISIKRLLKKFSKINGNILEKKFMKIQKYYNRKYISDNIINKLNFKKKKLNSIRSFFKKKKKIVRYPLINTNNYKYNFTYFKPAQINFFIYKLHKYKDIFYKNTNTQVFFKFIIIDNFFENDIKNNLNKSNLMCKIFIDANKLTKNCWNINSLELGSFKRTKIFFFRNKNKMQFNKLYAFSMHLLALKDTSTFYKNNYNYTLSNSWDKLYLDSYIGEYKKDINFFRKNIFYNNYYPLYNLTLKKRLHILKLIDTRKIPTYTNFYFYYVIFFLENLLGSKIWLKLNTRSLITEDYKILFKKLFYKNKFEQLQFGKSLYLIELYEILYLTLKNRDISLFLTWFKKIMEKTDMRKHKKLVKIIHNTLRKNIYFLTLTNTAGILFDIRGKLGVSGNAKKRHYAFNVGERSFTKKSLKLVFSQTTVRTDTGVMGVSMYIAY